MEDFQHIGYSKEVIEFVAVAKELANAMRKAGEFLLRNCR